MVVLSLMIGGGDFHECHDSPISISVVFVYWNLQISAAR